MHWMRTLGNIALLVVTWTILRNPALAESAAAPPPVVGNWLIEPRHYDAWTSNRVDAALYPLLIIRMDGTFTLYGLAPTCLPQAESSWAQLPEPTVDDCLSAAKFAARDGFRGAYLHRSASGRWTYASERLEVTVETVGAIAPDFTKQLTALRASLDDLVKSGIGNRRKAARDLLALMDAQSLRLGRFYTTLYIRDGLPSEVRLASNVLTLSGTTASDSLDYHAYRPEVIDTAMSLVFVLKVDPARYFRCLLAKVDREWPDADPGYRARIGATDFKTLLALARWQASFLQRRHYFEALNKLGRNEEAKRLYSEPVADAIEHYEDVLFEHPVSDALKTGTLGKYFGCPEHAAR